MNEENCVHTFKSNSVVAPSVFKKLIEHNSKIYECIKTEITYESMLNIHTFNN